MNLVYRLCQEGDEEKLSIFNQEACGNSASPEFWRWKYFENPAGPAIIVLAMNGERIVGRVGEIPVRIKIGEREVLAAQGVDTDILEEYRKGTTFFQMACLANENSEAYGISFNFGFAVKLTYEISIESLGFHRAARVRKWVKVLDPTPFVRKTLKIPPLPRFMEKGIRGVMALRNRRRVARESRIYELRSFDERFDRLWKTAIKGEVMVVRDSTYLNWRYAKCPIVQYKILAAENGGRLEGSMVLQLIERNNILYGYIVDMLIAKGRENCLHDLLPSAIDYFYQQGVAAVVCWIPDYSILCDLLKSTGFLKRPIQHYVIVKRYKEEETSLDILKEEKNWFYTFGDSDYLLVQRMRDF